MKHMHDFRLPPRNIREVRFSELLRSEYRWFCTDGSGRPIGPIFEGPDSEDSGSLGDRSFRNIAKELQLLAA